MFVSPVLLPVPVCRPFRGDLALGVLQIDFAMDAVFYRNPWSQLGNKILMKRVMRQRSSRIGHDRSDAPACLSFQPCA